ncbi:MAG TPA: hypothetical protein VMW75_17265 [Thermoanaerobaculia bacterium]|nr:hypothetical protein [Thermoanaerobaculia bacterium]
MKENVQPTAAFDPAGSKRRKSRAADPQEQGPVCEPDASDPGYSIDTGISGDGGGSTVVDPKTAAAARLDRKKRR